jgi:predicted ATPase/DNA-binding SARP family transcriptional activator
VSANGLASARKERTIEFRILGPLEVVEDGRTLSLGRGRERRLLGMLLLRANEVVSQDQLVDALWGESPPPTALTALHGSVSRLRGLLGAGRLQTTPPGYLLRLAPDELDLHRFERLVEEQRYEEALALWRGPALADLAFETFVQGEIARLEELRVAALEGRFERELADGRHAELVGELKAAVHAHPSRERLAAQLMVALYRCGRQAEALDAYRSVRTALVEELGLEPGEELRELQQRILAHDRRLDRVRPARRRATLPASTTSFVGRGRELGEVCALLERPELRLLTLIGAGGTGKTRLALEVAREMADEFRDGVRFVPLAAVADAALVAPEVAKALGLRQSQGQSIVDSVKAWVRGRELLLVLDNFEHVLEAAPFASELLAAAPGLKVLATSRRYLNLYGESEYAVPPLPVPGLQGLPDLEALGGNEAISLFVQRARAVKGDFALTAGNASPVADVCARLDGLPLAIELAAARVRAFAPAEILARLENRLELLTGGPRDVPARQRTLRDAILWSYELLPPGERRLFTRLAVFSGGWSPHTAVEVCGRDLKVDVRDALASLCAQNLIRREQAPHGRSRFTMLETIRELALEQLHASGEEAAIRGAHARAFLHAVEGEGPNLRGAARSEWLDRLANEHKNVRAALAWSVRDDGDIETGLRLAGAMFPFWMEHGSVSEAERFLSGLVSRSTEPSAGRGGDRLRRDHRR